ncbi:hypothetical protein [Ruminiclostridium josui]|uniref:hypothetical protein n=1 Tax=Ruminiclostridium josui TaxID=1499 RepID=UPI000465308A|nr:hypothetical protein [Ruminiclostridium josui]
MSIYLQPIKGQSTSNCFFFTLSTLLEYYKNGTSLHNACLWDFRFDYDASKRLEDCLFEDELYVQCYDFIFQVTGLSLAVSDTINFKQEIIKSLEKNKPVLVHYDSYFCPWSYNFKKYHYDHFFIVIDYDNGNYTCVDSFFLDETDKLSEELFDKGFMHIIDHEYHKNNTDTTKIINIVKDTMQANTKMLDQSKMFKEMLQLSDCILNIDRDREFEGHTDVKTIPLFTKIQNIVLNRNALSNVCEQLAKETGEEDYKEISELFAQVNQEWNMLLVLLMKFFVTGMQKPRVNSATKLKDIVRIEIQISEKLNKVCLGGYK